MKFEPMEFDTFVDLFLKATAPVFQCVGKGVLMTEGVLRDFCVFNHTELGNDFVTFMPERMIVGREVEIKKVEGITTVVMRQPIGVLEKPSNSEMSVATVTVHVEGQEFVIRDTATYIENDGRWILIHST